MNRFVYFGVFVVSSFVLGLAMLFLCAAVSLPERWPLAIVLLVVGGAGVGWSGVAYGRWLKTQPAAQAQRITGLAERNGGEVTVAQAMADLNLSGEAVLAVMNEMQRKGQCHLESRGETMVLVFPGLKERLKVRKCVYCGSTFPVRDPLQKCPNCGGNLEVVDKT